jgi:hypothetical protein
MASNNYEHEHNICATNIRIAKGLQVCIGRYTQSVVCRSIAEVGAH